MPETTGRGVTGGGRARFLRLAWTASLATAIAVPVIHFAGVFPVVLGVPKWDQWSMVPVWAAHFEGEPVLPLLTSPYNSHYNVVPRMIFYALGLVTTWDPRAEVVLSYVAALATLGFLLLMLRDSGRPFLLLAWLPALHVFSLKQFENYLYGYPFGQILSQAAATLTLLLLTRPHLRWRHLIPAIAAAAVATFSYGTGFAAWGAGLLALLFRPGRNRAAVGLWMGATIAAGAIVWQGAQQVGVAGRAFSAGLEPVLYALAILGNSLTLTPWGDVPTAMWLGPVAVVAFALALGCVALRGDRLLAVRWGSLGFLGLGGCLLIGYGRHHGGLARALAPHYTTAAYPLTVAATVLGAACLLHLARHGRTSIRRLGVAACAALLVAVTLQPAVVGARTLQMIRVWRDYRQEKAQLLLDRALSEEEIRRNFHPDPALVEQGLELHRRHRFAWRSGAR